METGEIIKKLNQACSGKVLEKSRFGRSSQLSAWVEVRALPEIAEFLKTNNEIALDWLENLSAIQMDKALVLTYFLRSTINENELILRATVVPSDPSRPIDVPSVLASWDMAAPFEAEIQELFGIRFNRTIDDALGEVAPWEPNLLPKDWNGFPLRKNYIFPTQFLGLAHTRKPRGPEGSA